MNNVLTIYESDIIKGAKNINNSNFRLRKAARAVVLDENNRVALLKANTYNYHKLPGGGVEDDEDMHLALERELLEEIGCKAEILCEVGEIVEYRDEWGLKQVSHCYLAKKIGEQSDPNFTQSEIDEGFEILWANNIDHAIQLLEGDNSQNYDCMFIQRRDLALLKEATKIII